MSAHHFIRQFGNRACGNFSALIEDAELACNAPGEGKFLLDQQDSEPCNLVQFQNNIPDFMNNVRLNSLGGLIQDEKLRFEYERPADRELLLLAAASSSGVRARSI